MHEFKKFCNLPFKEVAIGLAESGKVGELNLMFMVLLAYMESHKYTNHPRYSPTTTIQRLTCSVYQIKPSEYSISPVLDATTCTEKVHTKI